MSYYKAANDVDRRDNLMVFRASTSERMLAEKLKKELELGSVSALIRQLLTERATELGV